MAGVLYRGFTKGTLEEAKEKTIILKTKKKKIKHSGGN